MYSVIVVDVTRSVVGVGHVVDRSVVGVGLVVDRSVVGVLVDLVFNKLAPGLRFHPTNEELLVWYLKRKIREQPLGCEAIADIDFYAYEPWELPHMSPIDYGKNAWFFFVQRGGVRNRLTPSGGQWKISGTAINVFNLGTMVGEIKSLSFKWRGEHTLWRMKEYHLTDNDLGEEQGSYVISKVYSKGPWIEHQFREEEWAAIFNPPQAAPNAQNVINQEIENTNNAGPAQDVELNYMDMEDQDFVNNVLASFMNYGCL
ncbi:NAC domain-containing protein 13-like [Spinacia oleracea]|uniref:NAC domain-containing protein 13-like n=1 Tax=Spinacia oleracea TaxID=3562 RepID=A0ABM3RST8_SPIOL|nr:NAC domain-containing protein 13-like [Spinacia oleracea]